MTESPSTARGTTRRRVVLGVVAALAVAITVVVGIVVWGGSSGHEVSSDEAGRRIGTATSIGQECLANPYIHQVLRGLSS